MQRALRLAARGRYSASPNPCVGAVVVRAQRVVGEGYHRGRGQAHAERLALAVAGRSARGATLYVTLEPCVHWGHTPPCLETVLESGVGRVVVAHRDPDRRVAGRGLRGLRRAGLEVHCGVEAGAACELNWSYLVSSLEQRPGVTLKWAASLDGRVATRRGESQWITGRQARERALELRELHDCVLVGSGTILADNPRLNRRLGRAAGPVLRVVLDRRMQTPPLAKLFQTPGPVLVYTESRATRPADPLRRAGAEVVILDAVTPRAVLADLHSREVRSVLVEGGPSIAGSFLRDSLVDRVEAHVAPALFGGAGAPAAIGGDGIASLRDCLKLELEAVRRLGGDLQIRGFRAGFLRSLTQRLVPRASLAASKTGQSVAEPD
jgi:diaminohydroxyphosphoribosylaminopyrimidine deaminase/5-amino-6-(5-phosphoribosylamino)uracil reductase